MSRARAKVTTRTGDAGYTGLLGKARVPKYDLRIEALGTLDEASSALGLARAQCQKAEIREMIYALQKDLYVAMAEVSTPPDNYEKIQFKIFDHDVLRLEGLCEEMKARVEIATEFIVPGGTVGGAALDLARTIIRRGERQAARLLHEGGLPDAELLRFLNRMSDLVFIMARYEEAPTASESRAQDQ